MDSVKVLGLAGTGPTDMLWERRLRPAYTGHVMDLIKGGSRAETAADLLFRNRQRLAGAWPSDLTDRTRDGILR